MDDAALVVAARAGDTDALAAIYDRYADRLHDYCVTILRDRDEAADAFHDAFVAASQRLRQLRDPTKLRPWLYAIARHEALRRARARARQRPTDEVEDVSTGDAELDTGARSEEAARLVWDAAGGLADRDRALLDLNLRHGLEGQELADAIGVETGHAYVLLSRLRDQVERSVGALLLSRYGRSSCPELAQLLAGWDGRYTPLIRKRVARHADGCSNCGERRRTLASPLALLSAVPLVLAPTHLRDRVLGDARLIAHHGGAPPWKPDVGGFPPPMYPAKPRRRMAAVAAALVVLLGTGLLLVLAPGTQDRDELPLTAAAPLTTGTAVAGGSTTTAVDATTTTTTTTGVGGTTAPTGVTTTTTGGVTTVGPVVGIGPRLRIDRDRLEFGADAAEQSLALHNDGDAAATWSATLQPAGFTMERDRGVISPGGTTRLSVRLDRAAVREGTVSGRIRITSDGGDATVLLAASVVHPPVIVKLTVDRTDVAVFPCSTRPTSATVRATIADESRIASATLRWRHSSGTSSSRALEVDAGTYAAPLGTFPSRGTVTWWVEASDELGARVRSAEMTVTVTAC